MCVLLFVVYFRSCQLVTTLFTQKCNWQKYDPA